MSAAICRGRICEISYRRLLSAAIHRVPEVCKPSGFIKINPLDRASAGYRFKIYFRGTKIVSGKLKRARAPAWRRDRKSRYAGDTVVERSIPKTREINLPMSYVCKRWPFQLLNCHGSLPSVEPPETFELPQRRYRRDSELLIMLAQASRNTVSPNIRDILETPVFIRSHLHGAVILFISRDTSKDA